MTAIERIELLLDSGTYLPMGRLMHAEQLADADRTLGGDGAVHGFGLVGGRPAAVFASDPTVKGATGSTTAYRVSRAHQRLAAKWGLPLFDLHQSGGARITDLMTSKFAGSGGSTMGSRHVNPNRPVLLTAILGDYWAPWNMVQADVTVMTAHAHAALTSPPLLEVATGQRVTADELGGSHVHATITGQVDVVVATELAAIAFLRKVFSYLPSAPGLPSPRSTPSDDPEAIDVALRDVLPENPRQSYDMRPLVERVVDTGSFLELGEAFAPNLITGLARIDGWPVAVIANQPLVNAGVLDSAALVKMRKVLELAGARGLPLVSFVDTPGVLTTKEEEHRGLITQVYRTSMERYRPRIPKVAIVVRKGIGFAYLAMSASDPEGLTFAWPSAAIAFTGPEPAARIVYGRELAAATDARALMAERAEHMRAISAPWAGAGLAYIDDVIDPATTRPTLIRAIASLRNAS